MGEPTQIVSAAFGLVKSAFETAKLLERLAAARDEAKELYKRTAQLHSQAVVVHRVLKDRQDIIAATNASSSQGTTRRILMSIRSSIDSCLNAVGVIRDIVRPLAKERTIAWVKRTKFVWSTDVIRRQEEQITLHLQLLGNSFHFLHTIDQVDTMRMVREVLDYNALLHSNAQQEASSVTQLVTASKNKVQQDDDSDDGVENSGGDDEIVFEAPTEENNDPQNNVLEECPNFLLRDSVPLAVAVRRKDADYVGTLVAHLDVTTRDDDDWTLIHHASMNLDLPTLRHLLSRRGDMPARFIDSHSKRGDTALILVAKQAEDERSFEVARFLLENGCDANEVVRGEGKSKYDALYYVMDHSKTPTRLDFADLLIENGAKTRRVQRAFPEGYKDWPRVKKAAEKPTAEDGSIIDTESGSDASADSGTHKESLVKRVFSMSKSSEKDPA